MTRGKPKSWRPLLSGIFFFLCALLPSAIAQPIEEHDFYTQEDLVAQKDVATATTWLVWLTIAQIALSAGALIGLFWTIRLTRQALFAAHTANAISSETARHELRAYVDVASVRDVSSGSGVPRTTRVELKNFGQTPARQVIARVRYERLLNDGSVISDELEQIGPISLTPTATTEIDVQVPIAPRASPKTMLTAVIEFRDMYDDNHQVECCFRRADGSYIRVDREWLQDGARL